MIFDFALPFQLEAKSQSRQLIFLLLETFSVEFNQRLTSTSWSIWKHQNLRVWNNVTEVSATVVERASVATVVDPIPPQQLQQSGGGGNSVAVGTSTFATPSSWHHPLSGRYKCNINDAFSSHLNRIGVGIFVRDSEGTFVLAKIVSYPCFYFVDVGEAFGLHSALQWPDDMQFDNVDFKTDSNLTYDAFHANQDDTSEFGCIISSC